MHAETLLVEGVIYTFIRPNKEPAALRYRIVRCPKS
jgi:hypothetical protein